MDLGTDPDVLGQWAREVEQAGYDELFIPEHVLGVNVTERPDWRPLNPTTLENDKPVYDHTFPFYEPFVAMGYLAAVTRRIGLTSGVMIAPQRQTALMAKQAAIADVLSRGRIRLGVGVGWNDAEFEALGADFTTRGRRLDEQLIVMRRLWTEESVTFEGQFDTLVSVGLAPLPVQRPIPIIVGGDSPPAMERAAALGDGWFLTHAAAECIERTQRFWNRVDELGHRDGMMLVGTVYQGHPTASGTARGHRAVGRTWRYPSQCAHVFPSCPVGRRETGPKGGCRRTRRRPKRCPTLVVGMYRVADRS